MYAQGDYGAFEELYKRHKKRVYSYLYTRVKQKNVVDEIFQNIFLKIHKSRKKYNSKYLFLKWMYTISHSVMVDYFKYKKAKFIEFDEEKNYGDLNEKSDERLILEDIETLNENEKKVIKFRIYENKDYDEISELLGTSNSNIRKIFSRGIGKIRKKLIGVSV